jgi:hypothetical protein
MYGYFTSPDEIGGIVYGTWVLANMNGADEVKIGKRLKRAQEMLLKNTTGGPGRAAAPKEP